MIILDMIVEISSLRAFKWGATLYYLKYVRFMGQIGSKADQITILNGFSFFIVKNFNSAHWELSNEMPHYTIQIMSGLWVKMGQKWGKLRYKMVLISF